MEKNKGNDKIKALIQLLDDPDITVFEEVSKYLIDIGEEIIPHLEKEWEISFNDMVQGRLESIIQKIQLNTLQEDLYEWMHSDDPGLLRGAWLVARIQYPNLPFAPLEEKMEKIRKDIWIELHDKLTALEKVHIFNHILYDLYKLGPNKGDYFSPQNNFINVVLESGKGNPVSIAIIYEEIARKLELPIRGVNLPGQFILAYVDPYVIESGKPVAGPEDILFYISMVQRGAVLGIREIEAYLKQLNDTPLEPQYYLPCSPFETIGRMVNNLIFSFKKHNMPEKALLYKKILDFIRHNRP